MRHLIANMYLITGLAPERQKELSKIVIQRLIRNRGPCWGIIFKIPKAESSVRYGSPEEANVFQITEDESQETAKLKF